MKTAMQPITGKEVFSDLNDPVQALAQFYYAFNNGDMDVISQNWNKSEEVVMNNPLGGIKRGWEEIRGVYEKIFNGPAKVYVEFYDYTIHRTNEMFYAVGRERGSFAVAGKTIDLKIRTSRIFKSINGIFRQVHHHGSIENPELLKEYQDIVLGK